MRERAPLVVLGPLSDTILYLNEYKIIVNGGQLSDLEYIPTKTEKVKYLHNAKMRTYHPSRHFKQRHSKFKQAQDHKKQWRID